MVRNGIMGDFLFLEEYSMKTMRVVMSEPEKNAYVTDIDGSLASMQKIVGGLIQAVYPFEEQVCLVCNDEGKLQGLPLNRALRDEAGNIYDIISGTAFLCDCSGDDFGSLSDEQVAKFQEIFQYPEAFMRLGNSIIAIKQC